MLKRKDMPQPKPDREPVPDPLLARPVQGEPDWKALAQDVRRRFPKTLRVLLSEVREPRWVPFEALIDRNREIVAETGEPHAVLNAGLLESAWAKPINRWAYEGETDLIRLAVALMAGVAQNHPFQQGNKRTAFEAGISFLGANGVTLDEAFDSIELADAFVSLIEHVIDEATFAERLRPHVRALG